MSTKSAPPLRRRRRRTNAHIRMPTMQRSRSRYPWPPHPPRRAPAVACGPGLGGCSGGRSRPSRPYPCSQRTPCTTCFPFCAHFSNLCPWATCRTLQCGGAGPPPPPPPPRPRHAQLPGNPFDIALGGHAGLLRMQAQQPHRAGEYGLNPFAAAPAPMRLPPAPAPAIERRRQIRLPIRAAPERVAEIGPPALLRLPQARRIMRPVPELQAAAELQAPALLGRPQTRRIIRPDPPAAIVAGRAGAGIGARAGASGQRAR